MTIFEVLNILIILVLVVRGIIHLINKGWDWALVCFALAWIVGYGSIRVLA